MAFKSITSSGNEKIKLLDSLKTEKGRKNSGMFLVEGLKMIGEAMAEGLIPSIVMFCDDTAENAAKKAEESGAEVYFLTKELLKKASDAVTPQGIIAAFPLLQNRPITDGGSLIVLDGVQDPGNCGTIWRTCEAAGFGGIAFCSGSANPFSPKVVRASMGAVFRVPSVITRDSADFCAELLADGYDIIISSLEGDDFFTRERRTDSKFALVIGSEAKGVSREVAALATQRYRLPMRGKTESLNAAVAAGILMYGFFQDAFCGALPHTPQGGGPP